MLLTHLSIKQTLLFLMYYWAKSTSFPQSVTLSDAENIVDVKRFVQANLSDIDAHYPDDFYNPAITRLYRLKEYMEENK